MAMQQRRCFEQATTFETPLEEEASRLRARAVGMPPGHEREIVLRMLREIEMTCGLTNWINRRNFSRRLRGRKNRIPTNP